MKNSNIEISAFYFSPEKQAAIEIAPVALPAYKNSRMGQQHRVTVKRKRRKAYIERRRVASKAPRLSAAKPRARKTAAASS